MNIFIPIINDSVNYLIADKYIPSQNTSNWSYPSWPSHLDHIIISQRLFDNIANLNQNVQTIRVDNYVGSFQIYDNIISDHLPVGINLMSTPTIINDNNIRIKKKDKLLNISGQLTTPKTNKLLIEIYNNGTVEKKVILD